MMKKYNNFYLIVFQLVIVLFVGVNAQAANNIFGVPDVENYTQIDYKATAQNWAITQDAQGIIYVANNDGMLEFDGHRWQLHQLPHGSRIRTVAYDPHSQRIYCGTFEEFGYWERDAAQYLRYYSLCDGNTMHNDDIWSIVIVGGEVFFHSFVKCFRYYNGKVTVTNFPAACIAFECIGNRLYAATIEGLYVFEKEGFRLLPGGKQFTGSRQINALLAFDAHRLLLVTGKGLYVYDGSTYSHWATAADPLLNSAQINRAVMTRDSVYVLGTILNGAVAVNKKGQLLYHLNMFNSLQNNTVLGMMNDRENNLWLALDNGITHVKTNSHLRFYRGNYDNVESIYAIAQHKGILYLATNKGLFCSDSQQKHFTMIAGTQGQVWDLSVHNGQLFCGHNAGTFRIEGRRATLISSITGGYCLREVSTPQGAALLQSTYTQLVVYRRPNGQGLWQYSHALPHFIEPIRYVETDHLGYLWAGHIEKGLFRIQLNSSLTQIKEIRRYNSINGRNALRVGVFKVNNRVVFTTGQQMCTYDDMLDSIVPYAALNKALGKYAAAHKIIPIGNNCYWIACNDELVCIAIDHAGGCNLLHCIPHGALQHRLSVPYECVGTMQNGTSLIGLNNGFAVLDSLPLQPSAPTAILLRKVEAYNKEGKMLPGTQNILLPTSFGNLRFTFAYPSYSLAVGRISLQYRLDGLESEWMPAVGLYEKEYSRLPSGKYTFAVQAVDPSKAVLAQMQYTFTILPPWYATPAALCAYIALGLLLILFSYKIWHKQLRLQQQRLLHKESQKQQEERNLQEQKISRLKTEKLEAEVLYKAKELAASAMSITQKNNVLLTLRQELQKEDSAKNIKSIVNLINKNLTSTKDWEMFEANFDLIHDKFFRHLKERFATLTSHDMKLCAYLRLNLSTKEIAQLVGNTVRGVEVARYRLRKKLQLPPDQDLNEFMLKFKG